MYGEALYSNKIGIANVSLRGAFATDTYAEEDLTDEVGNGTFAAFGVKVVTDQLNTIFKPSFEGQFGYMTNKHDFEGTANDYTATAMKYLVGAKLNEFLLPNTKLAVYYAGYQGTNRGYVSTVGTDTGYFQDQNNLGRTVSQDLLYVEANYYDLSFGYGYGNLGLSALAASGTTPAQPAQSAKGSVFKISYKVNF
ncbi:hypothetical protein [Deinococcus sp. JMULE3]|uniref:hypothetical protein n=1 Tax=Deinococcus sp. JMULE3 TaxID=2518341 RepID=UPI001575369A|nr:hypothetical protein [Deinococcus sp. JMULE3]NTY01060.1 hypothetical protein [Deinococcus sp. JMULE3]